VTLLKTPEDIYPDFNQWPESWEGLTEDLPYGREILEVMRPFIIQLIEKGFTRKTMQKHMGNLWLLGGEIIRDISTDEEYHIPPSQKIRDSVDSLGGMYCRHIDSDTEEKSYNATCKKLHRFLTS
jgi:hypothetical protein